MFSNDCLIELIFHYLKLFLTIEYEQKKFIKRPIGCSTNNTVERLKDSRIELSYDKLMYVSNLRSADFDDLPFDGDESLITKRRIYHINDWLINALIVDVYTNIM